MTIIVFQLLLLIQVRLRTRQASHLSKTGPLADLLGGVALSSASLAAGQWRVCCALAARAQKRPVTPRQCAPHPSHNSRGQSAASP